MTTNEDSSREEDERDRQMVLVGNDGGFGLPTAHTYERDDGTVGEVPPDEIFLRPLRTVANGWRKFHASRECGRGTVRYVENTLRPMRTTERYDWELYCGSCGHLISWDEILYISEEWYYDRMQQKQSVSWGQFENLNLKPEQVLELGPDPSEAALLKQINEFWTGQEQLTQEMTPIVETTENSEGDE